jgi:hypothetical protein
MRLVHYSAEPVEQFITVPDWERGGRYGRIAADKPNGLWVSDDDCVANWRDWCEGERFGCDHYVWAQELRLTDQANILFLRDADDLDRFSAAHGMQLFPAFSGYASIYIDWKPICRDYSGIVITPYVQRRRLELFWYYGWDCASGCIWDGRAVQSIGPAEPVEFRK